MGCDICLSLRHSCSSLGKPWCHLFRSPTYPTSTFPFATCSVAIIECAGELSCLSKYTTSFPSTRISPYAHDHGHSHRATCHPPLDCSSHIPCDIITRVFVFSNFPNSTSFQRFVWFSPTARKPSGSIPGHRPAPIRKPRQLLRPKE